MSHYSKAESEKKRYYILDGMRGIAALAVVIYHFNLHTKVFVYFNLKMFDSAWLAVDFFFMLSGFVIANSYASRLHKTMSARQYLCRRWIRLYPMFMIGLLIGVAVLCFVTQAELTTYSPRDIFISFLCNAGFIPFFSGSITHGIGGKASDLVVGAVFPANLPAWSLFFEMAASFAFLALAKFRRLTLLEIAAACLIAFIVNGFVIARQNGYVSIDLNQGWNAGNFLGGFPRVFFGFSLGMMIHRIACEGIVHRKLDRFVRNNINNSYILYFFLLLILAFPLTIKGLYPIFILAIIAPALVLIGSMVHPASRVELKIANFLGWISYPLYCLHYPIGSLVFFVGRNFHVPSASLIFIAICLTVATAIAVTRLLEEPIRRYLSRKLLKSNGFAIPTPAGDGPTEVSAAPRRIELPD